MTRPPERELTIQAFLGDGSRQIDVVKGVVRAIQSSGDVGVGGLICWLIIYFPALLTHSLTD